MLLFNALIEVPAGIRPDIICIAQATLVVVNKALLVKDTTSPDKCSLCDAALSGYTCRHLYQRTEEHKGSSSIGNHFKSN